MYTYPIHRLTQFFALFCILQLALAGCSNPQTAASSTPAMPTQTMTSAVPTQTMIPTLTTAPYWPTQGWRTSSPEQQGMDSQKLAQMQAVIQQKRLALNSLLIIRHGYLVSETYYDSYQQDTRHELFSCTKSFISTLVGIVLDQKLIDRLDHPILDFFPGQAFANLDSRKQAMTLDDLLTMRSGLDWHEGDPAYMTLYNSPDWAKYVLDEPMAHAPGTQFNYCSGCSHVLSAVLEETTGMGTRAFAKQTLFTPLGITNIRWDSDSSGIPIGGWGLQLEPRDMAKLGYLYLHNGQWDGQQIVSSAWVQNATQKHTSTDGNLGYGYQWWTYPSLSAYAALGRYGQTIFVIPASDLVIVTTAQMDNHDEIFNLIEKYIVPAVKANP